MLSIGPPPSRPISPAKRGVTSGMPVGRFSAAMGCQCSIQAWIFEALTIQAHVGNCAFCVIHLVPISLLVSL